MKGLFKQLFKQKNIITLDIGSHTIKLAEFSITDKIPTLENFAFLLVPDGGIEQGDLMNADLFTDILPEFISQNVTSSDFNLYISISGRSIIVRKLEILRSEKILMDDLVQEEISQNLPFDLDEINYDYIPMEWILPPSNENKVNILLIAAKNDIVFKIDEMIDNMGYKCKTIDMGGFALSACMRFIVADVEEKTGDILVLDIGKSGTMFIVLKDCNLIFSRYIVIGSDFYTVSLMKEMGIEYQEAESLKISWCSGGEVPPEVSGIMAESDRCFCDEIFVGGEYFKNQFPDKKLSQAYVTGGGSKMATLVKAIAEKFNISTKLMDPFETLSSNEISQDSLMHIRHFASSTIGTCLRGLGK